MILRKKNKAEGITIPDFKRYFRAVVIKTMWYWPKNKHINKYNKIESSDINPNIFGQVIFNSVSKNTQWGKDTIHGVGKTNVNMQENEIGPLSYTIHKN